MRVFYVAIFATAALFATAIARPGSLKKRHARKPRSIYDNEYQQSQLNPNLDAIPTDWKYNQLDQGSAVPHYPDYPQIFNSDWKNLAPDHKPGVSQYAGQASQRVNDVVDQLGLNSQMNQNDNQHYQETFKDMDEWLGALRHLNHDDNRENKGIEELIDTIHRAGVDQDSDQAFDDNRIPPIQETHLPDLFQQIQQNDGSSDDIEPPIHKKHYTSVGQQYNDQELNTNNINPYYRVPGYLNQDQDQDQDQDFDYDADNEWNDSDFEDDDYEDDDYDDYDDSDFSESFESEEDSQSVDDSKKGNDDQVGVQGPNEGFDGHGSIDRRLGNGLGGFSAQNNGPQVQRLERSGAPFENPLLVEECLLICESIRRTGNDSPVMSTMCDCADAPHMK